MRNARRAIAVVIAVVALCATVAQAAGGYGARARQPTYEPASLQLVGTGAYRTATRHPALRVTVCLRKRVARRFFDVRCATTSGKGRRVVGQVSVPGCVAGVWRTTSYGEAFDRNGNQVDQASAVSRRFRC